MVLLVLSAMATTSKLLYPQINNTIDEALAERYREISKYLLLNEGSPSNWGQNSQIIPEDFGLAKTGSENPYELDVDKVTRLNSENLYAISYAKIFTALKLSDASFRIEIKPIFDVVINLTATFVGVNGTTYQFEIVTKKSGIPIQSELKCYVIAENYLKANDCYTSDGGSTVNVTIPDNINGPAVLVALAKAVCDSDIASYGVYAFAHNSANPKPEGTFLKLSPLNYTLKASFIHSEINLSKAYALSLNYYSILEHASDDNQSVTFSLPRFLDSSSTIIILTGWNSTDFFVEWTAYPQIPLQTGANFASSEALSNVAAYDYIITINSVLYKCTVWLGGPQQ
jgi:hypothetical protein